MSEIADGYTHLCEDVPVVVAGGSAARLTPGRYLHYPATSHGRFLTSLCRAFGLMLPSFGDELAGVGALEGFVS
jgi:hypothetical protein